LQVDRIYGWKTCRNAPIRIAMNQQSNDVKIRFNTRVTEVVKHVYLLFVSCGRLFLLMFDMLIFLVLLLDCYTVQGTRAKY